MSDKKSGIYKIENLTNKRVYIGSSVNIRKRKGEHFSALASNRHRNTHLQRAWNKYGRDVFSFSIIEYCSPNILLEREQWWIDFFDFREMYNISPTAGNTMGRKCSENTKHKISLANAGNVNARNRMIMLNKTNHPWHGKHHSLETKKKLSEANSGENNYWYGKHTPVSIEVLQIDKKTKEIIATYPSMTNASILTNVDVSSISRCCRGIAMSAGGFLREISNE